MKKLFVKDPCNNRSGSSAKKKVHSADSIKKISSRREKERRGVTVLTGTWEEGKKKQ